MLHSITFNTPAATETVTIYDNTAASGTKIETITVPSSPAPVTLTYDVAFNTGLTIVTATASGDITVAYQWFLRIAANPFRRFSIFEDFEQSQTRNYLFLSAILLLDQSHLRQSS
jgi:hypothetical protein